MSPTRLHPEHQPSAQLGFVPIPAIDLLDGACVRLTQGVFDQSTRYAEDPIDVAIGFQLAGFKALHLVDLNGSRAGEFTHWDVLEGIARHTKLDVDVSGGFTRSEHVEKALQTGAGHVVIGSLAAREPELFLEWLNRFGPEKIYLSADAKDGRIAVRGWEEQTGLEVVEFICGMADKGVETVICTDIRRDGMLAGPSYELYESVLRRSPGLHLIASGGISSADHIARLEGIGVRGGVIGKALYEGVLKVEELAGWLGA